MPLNISSSNEERVKITASPVTAKGRPAAVDGALTVVVRSGDGTFTQDPAFPLEFYAVSGDLAADTIYDVSADADLGAGVVTISDSVTYSVSSATAASFGLSAGPAEPK